MIRFRYLGIRYGKGLRVRGHIGLQVRKGGKVSIGDHFTCSSGNMSNPMGRNVKCFLRVDPQATLTIGNRVGISSVTLRCSTSITIADGVMIGALTIITDSDIHSLDPTYRTDYKTDALYAKKAPVVIEKNAFIGACCFIAKGVTIGENAVVGAGSVVTRSIPANEIWAGNPARKIKNL
ncbi:MAG: acyltransferase [Alistipes sp.]|nr:acyltransferase [Alistipes sp.]